MSKKTAYSQVMGCDNIVTTSGQISLDDNGSFVGDGDVKEQTIRTLENVEKYLMEKGFNIKNISTLTIYLQDIERDFMKFDEGFREFFGDCKPSRTTIGAKLFKPEFLIEIQATANKNVDNTVI